MSNHKDLQKLSAHGLLISLGIIYGGIGTSPYPHILKTTLIPRGFNKLLIKCVSGLYRFLETFIYVQLKKISLPEERNFGPDLNFVTVEKVPLTLTSPYSVKMNRVNVSS